MTKHPLRAWLEGVGRTQADLALELGVAVATVSGWITRRRGILLQTALKIQRLTRGAVKPEDFQA
jgi:DNA-binding transcriptional regulator YdaS (Cro superfamily)